MPELPEVETVRNGLAPVMKGARFSAVELRRPDLRFPFPEGFVQMLVGRRVLALERRAKYLLARLDNGLVLAMHLGMSGRFRIEAGGAPALGRSAQEAGREGAHDHVVFHFESGAAIHYNDARRFGFMTLIDGAALSDHKLFRDLGPEPLSAALTPAYLAARGAGRAQSLKAFLLDQRTLAGLGNIYVCEALFRARASPFRSAATLATPKGRASATARLLAKAIPEVLTEAIAAGGSTLRDHRQADGSLGYFQHAFAVYGREGEICTAPSCGRTIIREVQNGRATFYCPGCQQ